MYRSYSVNDMPQPIRYSGATRDNRPPPCGNDNIHTDNAAAESPQSACECPPPESETAEACPPAHNLPQNCPARNCAVQNRQSNNGGLLSGLNLKNDDLILLAVVVILLMDGCEDKLLIAALGLVFFSDYLGF